MLIGAFELIQSKQLEYDSYAAYIEAIRDYWLARTALARAVGRKLPGRSELSAPKYIDVGRTDGRISNRQEGHKHEHHDRSPRHRSKSNETSKEETCWQLSGVGLVGSMMLSQQSQAAEDQTRPRSEYPSVLPASAHFEWVELALHLEPTG